MYDITLAFETLEKEKRFKQVISSNEEVGGILFWDWGRLKDLHYKRHEKVFGASSLSLIQDWIICPNTANLRDRSYSVSDLQQLLGIAERTADSKRCMFLHFHSHPNGGWTPSDEDKAFWAKYCRQPYSGIAQGVIARISGWGELMVNCYQSDGKDNFKTGSYLSWRYINSKIRRYAAKTKAAA